MGILGIKRLPAFAGADRVVESLLPHLPKHHDYTVYLLRGESEITCDGNVHYVYIPAIRGKHLRATTYFLLCSLHCVWRGSFDVVHVHNSDFGLFCPILRLRRSTRVIGTFHGDPYRRDKWSRLAKAFLRLSEVVFAMSCHELTSVASTKRVREKNVHFIPNGVEVPDRALSEADADALAAHIGVTRREFAMFACGRLDPTKGLHHLLAAYRKVSWPKQLLVIGDFSHDALYAARIREAAKHDPRVVLHEELLPRELLLQLVTDSAYFAFPSEVEAMSMMLLEAISCRKAVVCSDIPENVAVVGDGYPLLFASRDVGALRSVLEAPILRGQEREPLMERTYAAVADQFSWPQSASKYSALYEGAC